MKSELILGSIGNDKSTIFRDVSNIGGQVGYGQTLEAKAKDDLATRDSTLVLSLSN